MTTITSSPGSRTQSQHHDVDPSAVARDVLGRLEAAWNDADGAAFGAAYTPDASFVTVRGEHVAGRAGITAGHDGIFRTIYAGSTNRMHLEHAERVTDDVVLASSHHTLDVPAGPLAGRHQARSTTVIARQPDGSWLARASHNTLVTA